MFLPLSLFFFFQTHFVHTVQLRALPVVRFPPQHLPATVLHRAPAPDTQEVQAGSNRLGMRGGKGMETQLAPALHRHPEKVSP